MKKLLVCLLMGTLLIGTAFTVEAAKKIAFGKGKSSASVSGKVQGSNDVDYVIRASAGQTMMIDFKASKGAAYFNVLPPGSTGEAIFVGSSEGNHFKTVLSGDGDYTIRVYLMGGAKDSDKPVTYTLKVSVPVTAKSASSGIAKSGTAVAEKSCLAAVAKKVGVSASKLKVIDIKSAEAGIGVNIQVPDATAPWSCLSDKKGHVQGASFTGSEGDK
ncbi:hypothetical protein [Methylobacter sp. S3L5C]|uniref:hypothetical protein n=1 Tax=Methylobacter sp. S3L5C TaxID=2839024 RepID=UPI001FAE371A|nr:hypothetical protein [Methylobacter sp. S3L5C]UOA07161.1 hypothetical protein KKZ03_12695 [Methylobacter sp. S3L5C]